MGKIVIYTLPTCRHCQLLKDTLNHLQIPYQYIDCIEYPAIAKEMGISEKIFIEFVIEKSGKVTSARVVRGEDKHLRQEALRLVRSIPKMIPAKQRGTAVAVTFTLPINFSLQ